MFAESESLGSLRVGSLIGPRRSNRLRNCDAFRRNVGLRGRIGRWIALRVIRWGLERARGSIETRKGHGLEKGFKPYKEEFGGLRRHGSREDGGCRSLLHCHMSWLRSIITTTCMYIIHPS